jgi:hypothetical protein
MCIVFQAIAVEAGGIANQPTEQAGMTAEVIQKLQDKATVLTQERKKRGRTVPEDLISHDSIRVFHTLASHPVCISEKLFSQYGEGHFTTLNARRIQR